ncbi:ZIP zinc transporter-domain-containing protein [Hyaloraphidium curvatum]|nr:ZIP zinc transporter-domain-containing protein [Hyaloraphidium curvatum]
MAWDVFAACTGLARVGTWLRAFSGHALPGPAQETQIDGAPRKPANKWLSLSRTLWLALLALVVATVPATQASSLDALPVGAEKHRKTPPPPPQQPPPTDSSTYNLAWHLGAAAAVLGASALGALLPFAFARSKSLLDNAEYFNAGKAFGCGVLIATALIHMLPPAFEQLRGVEALKFYPPIAGLLALAAILAMHLVEFFAVESVLKSGVAEMPEDDKAPPRADGIVEDETRPLLSTVPLPVPRFRGLDFTADFPVPPARPASLDGNPVVQVTFRIVQPKNCSHGHLEPCQPKICGHTHVDAFDIADLQRRKISTYLLFGSVAVHSVIIGTTLGVESDAAFLSLLVALVFHQGFEGLALGVKLRENRELDPDFGRRTTNLPTIVLSLMFVLAAPFGVLLGIFLRTKYDTGSQTSRMVQGTLDAMSGGVLLYVGLVTFLSGELNVHTGSKWGKVAMVVCLWLGAAAMAAVGLWA